LFDEIKWAVKDEKKKEFDFDQYVLVSRCFLDTFTLPPSATTGGGKKNNNNKRKKEEKEEITELVFPNLEDEIFYEMSQWSFMWEAGGEDKPQEFEDSKPMRMCMLIDAKDAGTICEAVQQMFLALSAEDNN
jgi:protein BCP1